MVDVDSPVVLILQRGVAKARERFRITDPGRAAAALHSVRAYQRVRVKGAVEARAVGATQAAGRAADDVPLPGDQVADRQRRDLARDQLRQRFDASMHQINQRQGLMSLF